MIKQINPTVKGIMIIEMQRGVDEKAVQEVTERVKEEGFDVQVSGSQEKIVITVFGNGTGSIDTQIFEVLPGVEKVFRIENTFKLASRDFKERNTIVELDGIKIGGKRIVVMAGPCAVEDEEQILSCAKKVKELGGKILRGGAFKPRTSPFSFQGLKEEGLKLLAKAREQTGLLIVTEVVASEDVDLVSKYADILQIGARNMQNYRLLEAAGKSGRAILLKRGPSATIPEFLSAADYLLKEGNSQIILCERGIKTFGNSTRFTLDVGAIPVIKRLSHLPIIIDPSHAAGYFGYVVALARAGIAAGADGLIIEIHPNPQKALSDGAQSLTFSDFSRLMKGLKVLSSAIDREM